MLYVPTAVGDADSAIVDFYERFGAHEASSPAAPSRGRRPDCASSCSRRTHLRRRRQHRQHARDLARARIRRDLCARRGSGVVLRGASAGMICWFEAGVTDSFGPQLEGMDGLGFCRAARVRTTTARRGGGRATASSSRGLSAGDRRRRRRRRSTTSGTELVGDRQLPVRVRCVSRLRRRRRPAGRARDLRGRLQ